MNKEKHITHTACKSRLEKEGEKTMCCDCSPHDGCNFSEEKGWEEEFEEWYVREVCTKKDIKAFIAKTLEEQRERTQKLIAKELLICGKEGTPTSRLTSLAVAINKLNN